MNFREQDLIKRKLVAKQWLDEKALILGGNGKQDWAFIQQKNIINLNCCFEFWVQFLQDPIITSGNTDIQFLSVYGYFAAHTGENRVNKFGFFNENTNKYVNLLSVPIIPLTNPDYMGDAEEERKLKIGQTNKFGVKISYIEEGKRSDSKNKDKYKITGQNASGSLDKRQRKIKYGI